MELGGPSTQNREDGSTTPPARVQVNVTSNQAGEHKHASDVTQEEDEVAKHSDEHEDQPEFPLEDFDWGDLEQRFQEMIQQRDLEEQQLWIEFQEMIDFFKIWSDTSQIHEVDRSMKRLATRMAHVQSTEEQVEQKRQHYTKVVEAFKSALQLLNAT